MKFLPFWNNLSFSTKSSLVITVLLFLAVPFTVITAQNFKGFAAKASCVGDCYYPDPVVSWTKDPLYNIETCLNTTQRGGAFCSSRQQTGGTSISLPIAAGFPTYYWVDVLLFSTYPNVQWVTHFSGSRTCPSGTSGTCTTTLSWPAPVQTAQATYAGDISKNPCYSVAWTSCVSSKTTTYPSKTVQFVDFPVNLNFDVYVYIDNHLFNIIPNQNSGAGATFTKPTLVSPTVGQTGVSNNPNFSWSVVPGASRYGLWVFTSSNLAGGTYWTANVNQSSCSSSCNQTWSSATWTPQNGAPSAPATLASGATYYWLVWSCTTTSCPITGVSSVGNFTVTSNSLPPPRLISPISGATGVTNSPTFVWTPVSGATRYGVWLATSDGGLGGSGPFWYTNFYQTSCSTSCSVNYNNGKGWSSFGGAGVPPYILSPGQTYYWLVWPCNGGICAPVSMSKHTSFTVAGSITQSMPVNLSPANGILVNDGKPTFAWSPPAGANVDHYALLIKIGSSNFGAGNLWSENINPLVCYAKPNCSVPLDGQFWNFTAFNGLTYAYSPPNPLIAGDWYFMVIACKSSACPLSDMLVSAPTSFNVPLGVNAASNLIPNNNAAVGTCNTTGGVDVALGWTPNPAGGSQTIFMSNQNNNFAYGTYSTAAVPASPPNLFFWKGLTPNTTYYWKIGTLMNNFNYDSPSATFVTINCQPSSGLKYDLSRSGTKADLLSYIYQITSGLYDSHTGLPLGDVMAYVMSGESGGGNDCAYNPDYQTIGVFQYTAATWAGQSSYGANEVIPSYDSGNVYGTGGGCWRHPGIDPPTWSSKFGGNYDGNGWDPYAQIRTTKLFFVGKGQCNWSVYSLRWGCP